MLALEELHTLVLLEAPLATNLKVVFMLSRGTLPRFIVVMLNSINELVPIPNALTEIAQCVVVGFTFAGQSTLYNKCSLKCSFIITFEHVFSSTLSSRHGANYIAMM